MCNFASLLTTIAGKLKAPACNGANVMINIKNIGYSAMYVSPLGTVMQKDDARAWLITYDAVENQFIALGCFYCTGEFTQMDGNLCNFTDSVKKRTIEKWQHGLESWLQCLNALFSERSEA